MTKARDLANASTALSAVDATELGYLDGVTSNIQTQFGNISGSKAQPSEPTSPTDGMIWVDTDGSVTDAQYIAKNVITTTGDIIYASGANTPARLGIGSSAQVLTVSGGVPSWATPSTGTTFSGARVTKNPNQSVATATYTTITWNQEAVDVGGYHDNATNNTRLTVPTGKTGYFLVQWNLHPYNVTACSYKLLKNGTSIAQYSDSYNWTTGTEVDFTNQWLGALSAGDYVEIQFYQGTGGARNVYGGDVPNEPSWFQITYLGA